MCRRQKDVEVPKCFGTLLEGPGQQMRPKDWLGQLQISRYIYIYTLLLYIYISYIDYLIIVLLLYNEFAQALWICDTSAPEHLDTQGVLQRRRRCCAPMLASPGPDRRSGVLRPLGCGIFHGALSGSLRFLGFKETSQILGPDTAGVFRKSLTLGLKLPG